jgi:hypothetical protein
MDEVKIKVEEYDRDNEDFFCRLLAEDLAKGNEVIFWNGPTDRPIEIVGPEKAERVVSISDPLGWNAPDIPVFGPHK